MLHNYRAVTVFKHYDSDFPKEEWLETREWQAPSLTAHGLYTIRVFEEE